MVKKTPKSKRIKAPKGAGRKKQRPRAVLDTAAMAYAKLLADPCNAAVVHPIYPGGDCGFLFRAESFITLGTGATDTAGVVHWAPGYVNSSSTQLLAALATGGGASVTMGTLAPSASPGTAFLTSNAKGARCIAACMKVTYPGAEQSRSGRVHYGLTSAGMLDSGTTATPDSVAQALQHYSRTPTDTFEVIWRPNIGDTEFNDPSESSGALIRDRKSAITVAFSGLPVGVGMTFHFTAIYEWTPGTGLGVGHNALGKAISNNTLDQVLDALISGGFQFVKHAGTAAGHALSAAATAAVAGRFGVMPTSGNTRRIAFV